MTALKTTPSVRPEPWPRRRLPAPHAAVRVQTNAIFRHDGELAYYVIYRGPQEALLSLGIVSREALAPQPGRPRKDAAGRGVILRRVKGELFLTFHGDPFAEPRLPHLSDVDLARARARAEKEAAELEAHFAREAWEEREREQARGAANPRSDRSTDLACMRANLRICRDVAADALSGQLLEKVDRSLGELLAIVTREIDATLRGGRLRLVVDNDRAPEQQP